MTRFSLVPLAAALFFAETATSFSADSPADASAWARAINLMPLIDPGKDTVKGTWRIENGKLLSGSNMHERIVIPYEPPEEYDFRIVFCRMSGEESVVQYVSQAGRMALWLMGGGRDRIFGFELVNGKMAGSNQTTVRRDRGIQVEQVHTSVLKVRRDGVKAYLDGELITQWQTDFSDARLDRRWDLPDQRLLGVGSWRSPTAFHKTELLEITGKGRVMPRTEIAKARPRGAPTTEPKKSKAKEETPRPPRIAGMADTESQKDAKKFSRQQSSIKGLYVVRTEAGLRVGGAQDIIATAERASSDRETICDFVGEVAKDTQISMEEAERLLKVRYPVWQAGYKIRFSYSNKYSKQGGGSAGGAFSVLLLSLLDGMQIDPGFAMTGDVTVDGKIREVGAVAEKIRGAMLEKCATLALPVANKENLNDLALLYSPSMLWAMQLFSIATLDDAAAVARVDRKPELAKAMEMFGQVQRALGPNATAYALRSPGVVATLQQVLQLAPNHLSAEFMLRAARGQMPTTLSLGGSLDEIWAAAGPLLGFLFSEYKEPDKAKRYYFDKVPTATFKAGMDRLNWLQMRLHPKTQALRMAMAEYMTSLDQMHRASSFSAGALKQHLAKRDKVLSEAHTLGTDRKTLEEMMH